MTCTGLKMNMIFLLSAQNIMICDRNTYHAITLITQIVVNFLTSIETKNNIMLQLYLSCLVHKDSKQQFTMAHRITLGMSVGLQIRVSRFVFLGLP